MLERKGGLKQQQAAATGEQAGDQLHQAPCAQQMNEAGAVGGADHPAGGEAEDLERTGHESI